MAMCGRQTKLLGDRHSPLLPENTPGPIGDAANLETIQEFFSILFHDEMINIIVECTNHQIENEYVGKIAQGKELVHLPFEPCVVKQMKQKTVVQQLELFVDLVVNCVLSLKDEVGELFMLYLTREEHERAIGDMLYALQLLDKHKNAIAMQLSNFQQSNMIVSDQTPKNLQPLKLIDEGK
ncbi:hypothetical protein PV325_009046, partial [Microctonus aethiopoides]